MKKGNRQVCVVSIACIALLACGDSFSSIVAPGSGGYTASSGGSGGTAVSSGGMTSTSSFGGAGGEATTSASGGFGGTPTMCNADEKACGNTCANVDDPEYGCDPVTCEPCSAMGLPNVSSYACEQGSCVIGECVGTYSDCDEKKSNGCEADTATDPKHCGQCKHECSDGACEAEKCNPFCGPKKVPTQGLVVCFFWDQASTQTLMGLRGIVGATVSDGIKALTQFGGDPCLAPDKNDKHLICQFGPQPQNVFVQLSGMFYMDSNFTNPQFGCNQTQYPAKCFGSYRVWRDGDEVLPEYKDTQGNTPPAPWSYAQIGGIWAAQRTVP